MKRVVIMALALVAAVFPAFCADEKKEDDPNKPPTYNCKRIEKEITLTGKLDDPLWKTAEVVELVDAATGIRKGYHTKARMLWSQKYLYVGFECEDEYVWGTLTKRDEELYMEEVVEIFVCPTGKIRQYYEIEVSPLNTILDTFVLNGKSEKNRRWDNFHTFFDYDFTGMITKVHVDGELNKVGGAKGWSVEMAIPFAALIGNDTAVPAVDDEWRMNLLRVDMPETKVYGQFSWSPIMVAADFHRPWRFGYLKFCK
jgi:hypothetical protein